MSSSHCCFMTCIQVSQEAGQLVWYSHLLKNFPQFTVIHTIKGFGIVNKVEIGVFLELFCFFDDSVEVGNLISGSSAFSKSSLNIWKFTVHVLLKPSLENFEHYFTSVWDECNCVVVWAFCDHGTDLCYKWNFNKSLKGEIFFSDKNNDICTFFKCNKCSIPLRKLLTKEFKSQKPEKQK